ncbi:MAG: Lpg1974 family pore-forming outer membrane protein [Legionellaceae bacterium]|nr:Lpg1974 family pore-forming outer membrane protein [Legionellaceae bacterium]
MRYRAILGIFLSSLLHSINAAANTLDKEKRTDTHNQSGFHIGVLSLQPQSNNLAYAYWVAGIQPYYQNWHAQMLNPSNSLAYELGYNYAVAQTPYSASIDWLHINTSDSSFKQASESSSLLTIEFVAPPFEMSPPVFGIKRADSNLKFGFDNVGINVGKLFEFNSKFRAKLVGGIDILHVDQTITTVFGDFQSIPGTPYSYTLDADPSYSLQVQSQSKYVGVGPDLGLDVEYDVIGGFGMIGQAKGSLTAGTTSTEEFFQGTSANLTALGIGISHQQITTPNKTQVVPGFDGKLGLYYRYFGVKVANFTLEGGYRMLTYLNAITTITPATLVQPGTVTVTPEFATGTLAIVSITKQDSPFNLNGPYINLKIGFN